MKPALVINTHSSNEECLKIFFFCMEKYIGVDYFNRVYVFADKILNVPSYASIIRYNDQDNYRDQMIKCLGEVNEDVILYANEDYLFYDKANLKKMDELLAILERDVYSFIKFVHTDMEDYCEVRPQLFLIDKTCRNNFSQTLSFCKTADFLNIHKNCPPSEIGAKGDTGGHLEVLAQDVCRKLNIKGLCYYNNEPKRGMVHFDSDIIPHIASAINRGKWTTEYPKELKKIKKEYQEQYENSK